MSFSTKVEYADEIGDSVVLDTNSLLCGSFCSGLLIGRFVREEFSSVVRILSLFSVSLSLSASDIGAVGIGGVSLWRLLVSLGRLSSVMVSTVGISILGISTIGETSGVGASALVRSTDDAFAIVAGIVVSDVVGVVSNDGRSNDVSVSFVAEGVCSIVGSSKDGHVVSLSLTVMTVDSWTGRENGQPSLFVVSDVVGVGSNDGRSNHVVVANGSAHVCVSTVVCTGLSSSRSGLGAKGLVLSVVATGGISMVVGGVMLAVLSSTTGATTGTGAGVPPNGTDVSVAHGAGGVLAGMTKSLSSKWKGGIPHCASSGSGIETGATGVGTGGCGGLPPNGTNPHPCWLSCGLVVCIGSINSDRET